jgi:hypothetical protein
MSKNFQPNIFPNRVVVKRRKSPLMASKNHHVEMATDVADLIACLSIKQLIENLLLICLISPNSQVLMAVKRRKSPFMASKNHHVEMATHVADLIACLSIKQLMENLLLMSLIVGPSNWH